MGLPLATGGLTFLTPPQPPCEVGIRECMIDIVSYNFEVLGWFRAGTGDIDKYNQTLTVRMPTTKRSFLQVSCELPVKLDAAERWQLLLLWMVI